MSAEFDVVADYPLRVGENPLWNPHDGRLYWCGVYEGSLFRYDPATGDHARVYRGDPIGGFTVQSDGSLLLFQAAGAVRVWTNRRGITRTVLPPNGPVDARFNDVVADPRGRVLCGTYPQDGRLGTLYRLDTDGSPAPLIEDVRLSNGLGFAPDHATLYYAESEAHTVHRFAYDEATGELTDRSAFVELDEGDGLPDGLTVDAEGDVWVAHAFGGCVVRYTPDGTERERLSLPTPFVTSAAFGGADLRELYVTTGGGEDRSGNGPGAGSLYRLRPGPAGRAPLFSAL